MGEKTPKEIQVVPPQNSSLQISELRDPEKEIEFAQKAAKALVSIISNKKKKVVINNEQYLEYGDWQTIARFYGITVGSEQTEEINKDGKLAGFKAKAIVYRNGTLISSAEASCMRDEKNWMAKPEFQLRSMAQTRAAAKALRNVLGWVVELAGYNATPAEEMNGAPFVGNEFNKRRTPAKVQKPVQQVKPNINSKNDVLKATIKKLCDELGPAKKMSSAIEYRNFVKHATELELVEGNYEEIVERLKIIKEEREGA